MIRTIILDDELLALRQLSTYVGRLEELTLVGSFRSAIDAEAFIREGGEVDLIFSDINMPEVSGVEFVRSLSDSFEGNGNSPMVIFTTAHSEYAVEGFRLDAVDYLLKPLSFDDFSRSVKRAHSLYTLRNMAQDSNLVGETTDPDTMDLDLDRQQDNYITVKSDYKYVPICLNEIIYIESEGEYIRLHLISGRAVTTFYRLKNIEMELPSTHFMRIHRSYIVNVDSIKSYERTKVYITESDYLPIGQNYREPFLQFMSNR